MEENNVVETVVEEVVENTEVVEKAAKNIDWKKIGIGGGIAAGVAGALATGGYFLLKHFADKD